MIHSFRDALTLDLFDGLRLRSPTMYPPELGRETTARLQYLHAASRLDDLRVLPGFRQIGGAAGGTSGTFEFNAGKGYDVQFEWHDDGAHDVRLTGRRPNPGALRMATPRELHLEPGRAPRKAMRAGDFLVELFGSPPPDVMSFVDRRNFYDREVVYKTHPTEAHVAFASRLGMTVGQLNGLVHMFETLHFDSRSASDDYHLTYRQQQERGGVAEPEPPIGVDDLGRALGVSGEVWATILRHQASSWWPRVDTIDRRIWLEAPHRAAAHLRSWSPALEDDARWTFRARQDFTLLSNGTACGRLMRRVDARPLDLVEGWSRLRSEVVAVNDHEETTRLSVKTRQYGSPPAAADGIVVIGVEPPAPYATPIGELVCEAVRVRIMKDEVRYFFAPTLPCMDGLAGLEITTESGRVEAALGAWKTT